MRFLARFFGAVIPLSMLFCAPVEARDWSVIQKSGTIIAATEEITGQRPNIDLMLAAICHANELPATPALVIFAAGRLAGWLAHALEQQAQGNLIRPRASYTGVAPPVAESI